MNIEVDTYDVLYKLLKKEPYLVCLKSVHDNALAVIRKKKKVKVAFQISCLAEWIGNELVYRFINNDRFDVMVVIAWQVNTDCKYEMTSLSEFFQDSGIPYCYADGSIHPKDFDIIFYTSPYLFALQNWGERDIPLSSLVCYIPYGFYVADIQATQFNLLIHNIAWRNYVSSPIYCQMADKYCDIGHYGMVVSGYSKLDNLLVSNFGERADWKIADKTNTKAKKIIYAPHHSINEVPYHSTFFMNYKYIFKYAKEHPDTTSWVFKPHPLLRISAVRNGIFSSEAEFDEYCQAWDLLPNARYVTGEYMEWFASSDCMIFDSMSFMAEYLYVNKPSLFLTREAIHLNEIGLAVLEVLYQTKGNDYYGIRKFIESDSSVDRKKDLRESFFSRYLEYYERNGNRNSAEYIYEDILRELY